MKKCYIVDYETPGQTVVKNLEELIMHCIKNPYKEIIFINNKKYCIINNIFNDYISIIINDILKSYSVVDGKIFSLVDTNKKVKTNKKLVYVNFNYIFQIETDFEFNNGYFYRKTIEHILGINEVIYKSLDSTDIKLYYYDNIDRYIINNASYANDYKLLIWPIDYKVLLNDICNRYNPYKKYNIQINPRDLIVRGKITSDMDIGLLIIFYFIFF